MANTTITYREIRYIIHDNSIEVYVRMDAHTDVPLGVQGWHYKHFVDGVDMQGSDTIPGRTQAQWSVDSISISNSVMWPQKAP